MLDAAVFIFLAKSAALWPADSTKHFYVFVSTFVRIRPPSEHFLPWTIVFWDVSSERRERFGDIRCKRLILHHAAMPLSGSNHCLLAALLSTDHRKEVKVVLLQEMRRMPSC